MTVRTGLPRLSAQVTQRPEGVDVRAPDGTVFRVRRVRVLMRRAAVGAPWGTVGVSVDGFRVRHGGRVGVHVYPLPPDVWDDALRARVAVLEGLVRARGDADA